MTDWPRTWPTLYGGPADGRPIAAQVRIEQPAEITAVVEDPTDINLDTPETAYATALYTRRWLTPNTDPLTIIAVYVSHGLEEPDTLPKPTDKAN